MKKIGFKFVVLVLIMCLCGLISAAEETEKSTQSTKSTKYHGKKGDFIFDDADIKNVLLFFSKTYKFNIVIDPGISGKVNVRLIDVPWDQALDLILRTQGLAFIVQWSDSQKGDKKENKKENKKEKKKKIKSIRIRKLPKS